MNPGRPRIFISYARRDGEPFARRLRERLARQGFSLWQDRTSMEGGKDWWDQIDEALKHVEYMVLVMTPAAAASDIVRKEWRLARQRGVCVIPVFGAPGLDLASLPRWMREIQFVDTENREQWTRFVRTLEAPCRAPRVPFMADDLPKDFVPRPEEFEALAGMLLAPRKDQPVALTAALRGAGGYGKTTLAAALCHDERIGEEFHDGILWVTLGREPGEVTGKVADLIETLTGDRPGLKDADAAAARLAEVLADRDLLLVIDDVWNSADALPFLRGGSRSVRLLTTRNADTLPPECRNVNLDAMRQTEAVELLGYGLPAGSRTELIALAARLCEWPLLLKLVNGALRKRVNQAKQPLEGALRYVNLALDQRGLTAFDAREPRERNQAAGMTLDLSLSLLDPAEQERTGELGVFPEDADIPLSVIATLWQATGGLDEIASEELCLRLDDLSLAAALDLDRRTLRLHDVVRAVLRSRGRQHLAKWNAVLLDAHRPPGHWADLPPSEPYLWRNLAYHLVEAGRADELKDLVFDFRWLAAKLSATDLDALLADSGYLPGNEAAVLLNQALRLSAHVIAGDPRQLAGQITGRLIGAPDLGGLLQSTAESPRRPWLKPSWPSLTPPGTGLVRTLAGHSSGVNGVAVTPDGRRAVSASDDQTLKVWDLETGRELRTLAGHSNWVHGVAVTPDGRRAVSASYDNTLKLWDLETGRELHTLAGHSAWVTGVAVTPDGCRAVSASDDKTLKVWDLETGRELRTLAGDSDVLSGVAVTPDGRSAVSASHDKTLKVWDLETGRQLRTLAGHSGVVRGVAVTPDGRRAISASFDETLKVWDLETGRELRTLAGHSRWVYGVAVSPDGRRAISASFDKTLKVWDLETGRELRTLAGHSGWVYGVAVSPDGRRAVSASDDQTLKVWDLQTGRELPTLARHSNRVLGGAVSPDGRRAVSASEDNTLKVWDLETGRDLRTLAGHSNAVAGVAVSPDGRRAVSASWDGTLKVWDLETGRELRTLAGHSGSVTGVALSPDGRRAISASADQTLKVWDLETGRELRTLAGHSSVVNGVAVTPDGRRAVSASWDQTLKVWDLETGRELHTLAGHSNWVNGVAVSPDGRRAVSASYDNTLKVWDLETGRQLRTLTGHSNSVLGVAVSPDGGRAVSASYDNTLKVWDLETGDVIATFTCDASADCCAFTDAHTVLAGDALGRLHLLELVE